MISRMLVEKDKNHEKMKLLEKSQFLKRFKNKYIELHSLGFSEFQHSCELHSNMDCLVNGLQ